MDSQALFIPLCVDLGAFDRNSRISVAKGTRQAKYWPYTGDIQLSYSGTAVR